MAGLQNYLRNMRHVLMLSVDRGAVYAAGSNVNAQLGLGNQSPHVATPTRVCHSYSNICQLLLCTCVQSYFSLAGRRSRTP